MQNLRDKLLKAGLVTEKQAKEADRKGAKPRGNSPSAPCGCGSWWRRTACASRRAR